MEALQERIQRFTRLGGVDLSRLDRQERQLMAPSIHMGVEEYKRAVFTFRCGMCGNVVQNNQDMEPMCTGPNWTDDHPPHVMRKQS